MEIPRHPVGSQRQLIKEIHNSGREMDKEQCVRGLKLVAGISDTMDDPRKLLNDMRGAFRIDRRKNIVDSVY